LPPKPGDPLLESIYPRHAPRRLTWRDMLAPPIFLALLLTQAPETRGTVVPVLIDGEPATDLQVSFIAGDDMVRLEPSADGLTIALADLAGLKDNVIVAATDGERRCAAYLSPIRHAAGDPIQLYWEGSDPDGAGITTRIEWIGTTPQPKRHDGYPGRGDEVKPNITGHVRDLSGHPVPGAYVSATPRWAWPNVPRSQFTDSTGRFQFDFHLARTVEIRAYSGSAAGIAKQSYPDETTPTFLPMEVTLDLTPWSEETIRVLDLSREPVAGVRVCAGWRPSTFSVVTDQDGLARLPMLTAPPWTGGSIICWGTGIDGSSVRPMDRSADSRIVSVRRTEARQGFLDQTLDPSVIRPSLQPSPLPPEELRRALCEKILALPVSDDRGAFMRIARLALLDKAAAREAFADWPWQDHQLEAEAYFSLPEHQVRPIPDGLEPLTRRLAYATAAWLAPNPKDQGAKERRALDVGAQAARRLAKKATEELLAQSIPLTPADGPEIDAWTRALATRIPWEANAIRRRLGWRAATRPPATAPLPMTPANALKMIQNGSFQATRDLPRVMAARGAPIELRLAVLLDPPWETMTAPHWLALRQLARELIELGSVYGRPSSSDPSGLIASFAASNAIDWAALEPALQECVRRSDLFAFGDDARAARAAALATTRLIRPDLALELEPITTDELLAQVKRSLTGSPDRWFALDSELLEASLEVLAVTSLEALEAWVETEEFATIGTPRFHLVDALWPGVQLRGGF
jgi:hypothetical protein